MELSEEKKQFIEDLLNSGGSLLDLRADANQAINELERLIVTVGKSKALSLQRHQEKKRTMERLQSNLQAINGQVHQLQHQMYNDMADQASLQSVIDLLQREIKSKTIHCQKVGIFPSDSLSEDDWQAIANHKYFDQAASLKAKEEGGTSAENVDSLAAPLHDEKKVALASPPASTTAPNTRKRARK